MDNLLAFQGKNKKQKTLQGAVLWRMSFLKLVLQ